MAYPVPRFTAGMIDIATGGPEALADHRSRPDRVWNRIPDGVRRQIIDLALELPELSPRELAVRFTDENKYFVSEASVYRLLKAHDLITSPAYVVIKAANEFYKRMLGFQGPAQPSPALGDAMNAGYRYLEVKCLGCNTHQTVALDIVRRPKATPVHELERYMRCKDCSQVRGYPYKRSHLVALRTTKITASDPPSTWWPGER